MREEVVKFEDRYKLKSPIQQGERATFWDAEDTKLARRVVVALVESDSPEPQVSRFVEAMEALAKLRHANLVRVLEVGRTAEDAPYAILERVEGDTLEARLARGPAMRLDQAVRMIADLCAGLAALHKAGVAHGDIHPGNVIVRELGGRSTPKLRPAGPEGPDQRKGDEPGGELSALAYMAPGQARGEVLADPVSDVYSVAAMAFSLLTGRLPHRGSSPEALRRAIVERAAPAAADVRPELAGPIAEVLDLALSPEPEQRYSSADALAKALRTALIRTRNPSALKTVVGERVLEADESDEELAVKRLARPSTPKSGAKAMGVSRPGVPPKPAPPGPKPDASKAPPSRGRRDESLEFEQVSGLLELPDAAAPPPPPKGSAQTTAGGAPASAAEDDSLEFERLSGLLEVPAETNEPPPPPAARASSGDESKVDEQSSKPATKVESTASSSDDSEASAEIAEGSAEFSEGSAEFSEASAEIAEGSAEFSEGSAEFSEAQASPKEPEATPAEEVAASRSGIPGWTWAAMGLGVAAVAILGFVLWPSTKADEEEMAFAPSTPAVEASEVAEARAAAAPPEVETEPAPEAAPPPPSPEPDPIRLTLTNVPEGATITIDGTEVEGTEIELAPSEQARTVTVRLDNHEPWTRQLPGDRSAELRVELRPEERAEPAEPQRVERRRTRRAKRDRARSSSSRASRAKSSRRSEPGRQSSGRRGARPAAIRDPGF